MKSVTYDPSVPPTGMTTPQAAEQSVMRHGLWIQGIKSVLNNKTDIRTERNGWYTDTLTPSVLMHNTPKFNTPGQA